MDSESKASNDDHLDESGRPANIFLIDDRQHIQRPPSKKTIFRKACQYLVGEEMQNDQYENVNTYDVDSEIKKLNEIVLHKLPDNALYYYTHLLTKKEDYDVDLKLLDRLIRPASINFRNEHGDTPLHEACKLSARSKSLIEVLVKNKADIYAVNKFGQSVLHVAAVNDNHQLIKYFFQLIDHSLDVNRTTVEEKQTALHYACRTNSINAIGVLVGALKADKEAKDYQGRTPLYIAAEYGNSDAIRKLIDLGAIVDVENIYGQKALFWICSKLPHLAVDVLNSYQRFDAYSRQYEFFLNKVDLSLFANEKGRKTIPKTKSILMYIVENNRLDLIAHPVFECLITAKWKDFARTRCYIDMLATIINLVVWNLLAVLVPYNKRHVYTFPQDWWRIFLFAIGLIGIFVTVIFEIIEFVNVSRYQKMATKQRLEELDQDERFCHPSDEAQKNFLKDEKNVCVDRSRLILYFQDKWNWYDWTTIVLLLAVIFTHVADVLNHSETLARVHIRIFSITVVFLSVRVFETGRVINERFGMLVVTLSFTLQKIIVWLAIYFMLLLPFACAIWMIYGNVSNPPRDIVSYDKTIFVLWLVTFGQSIDEARMNEIDPIMSNILVGLFIGLFSLLMINVFIALLTSTFDRVYSCAKAYFLLQRATRIIEIEHELPTKYRIRHLNKLGDEYKTGLGLSTLPDRSDSDVQTKETLNKFREKIGELKTKIAGIKENMDDNLKKLMDQVHSARANQKPQRKERKRAQNDEEIRHESRVKNKNVQVKKLADDMAQFKHFLKTKFAQKSSEL